MITIPGIDPKMQARYNIIVAKRNSKFIDKLNKVRKIAAVL